MVWLRWTLLISCGSLAGLSLIALASIQPSLMLTQAGYWVVAIVLCITTALTPWRWWRQLPVLSFIVVVVLLLATLLLGEVTRGSQRWINLGVMNLQASQLVIPAVALTISAVLTGANLNTWWRLTLIAILTFVPAVLIFLQPDLGTTLWIIASLGSSVLLIHVPRFFWPALIGSGVVIAVIMWTSLLQPYQRTRLLSFVGSDQSSAASYNTQQSLISIGSGGLWGAGLGHGTQAQLGFLPENHTDFIFASWAEETGLVGSLVIISVYTLAVGSIYLLFYHGSPHTRPFLWIVGWALLLQSSINIGMNLGLLPVTGLSLPGMSFGGSSLAGWAIMIGLVVSASRHSPKADLVVLG